MAVVETSFVYIVLLFASVSVAAKSFPGAAASLLNLRIFEILPDDALAAAAGTLTGKKGAKSTAKDNAAANAGLVTDLSKAQTFSRPLTIRDVHTLSRQLAAFNDAAGLLLALLLQLIFGEFLSRTFRRESSPFLACLAAFCLVHVSLRALLPTVLSPISVTGRLERTQTYTVLGMMFVGAAAFAILLPSGWLDVDVRLGASALKEAGAFWAGVGATLTRMGTMVREGNFRDAGTAADPRRQAAAAEAEAAAAQAAATAAEAQALEGLATADGMENVTTPAMPPISGAYIVGVTLPTALAVGAYIGLLLLPLIRLARCASAALHPPVTLPGAGAASMPLDTPLLSRLAAWLAVAAPPLVLLLWLRPFAGDLLGLGADARGAAQAAGLLACGALQLLALRPHLQAYFNTAMFAWFRAKNGVHKPAERKAVAQSTGALVGNTNALFPTVVTQLAAPAVALVALGALLWDGVGWRRGPPEVSDEEALLRNVLTDFFNPNKDLVRVVASAGGCAALAAHTVCVLGGMALVRMGVLRC